MSGSRAAPIRVAAGQRPRVASARSDHADGAALSHNLLGQRLGRKGRDTRERILAAADRLLADPLGPPFSLSGVAREASLGMTTLYLYFGDLGELLLAVLEPIAASAEASYVALARRRWPDEELGDRCLAFVEAFHAFWARHARVLHLRNRLATERDPRMARHRIATSGPLVALLEQQMTGALGVPHRPLLRDMAAALLTGTERLVTMTTDAGFTEAMADQPLPNVANLLRGQARLIELAVRDGRTPSA